MMHAPDDFHQLKLRFVDPIEHDYEAIRPVVLADEPVTDRSQQTGIARTVVGDKARRFLQRGMLGLVDQRAAQVGRKPQAFPEPVAAYILYLKQLYPLSTIAKSCVSSPTSLAWPPTTIPSPAC